MRTTVAHIEAQLGPGRDRTVRDAYSPYLARWREILAALEETVGPITDGWLEKIQRAVNEAPDLESLASRLLEIFPTLTVDDTATVIGQALALGNVAARDLSVEG